MTGARAKPRPFMPRLARRTEQALYDVQRRAGLFRTVSGNPRARLGIYVAYFDAAWVFEDHLRCIRDLSAGPVNYYVMANCTSPAERAWFDGAIERFQFPIPFYPWAGSPILAHGESLQRMIERTDDEIIVLCDVDAFPIRYGWDDYVVQELKHKDVIAVIVDMPSRAMPVFLHPSFMAFRRNFLVDNRLDMLPSEGNDPAWRITDYLQSRGLLTPDHVSPLFPTSREVSIYPTGTNQLFGRSDLVHGFGTTYGDLVFHFWFARYLARREEPKDEYGNVLLSIADIDRVVNETLVRVRNRCTRGSG